MSTPSKTPDELYPLVDSLDQFKGRWFIAETFMRHEKSVAFGMAARDIGYYLPIVDEVKWQGGRRRTYKTPLIGGRVFVNFSTDAQWYQVREHPSVLNVCTVVNQRRLLSDLTRVRHYLNRGYVLDQYDNLRKGSLCTVKAGGFRGMEGKVEQRNGDKVIIEIEAMHRKVMLSIEASKLEVAA